MEDINITRGDIQQLLLYFSKNTYKARETDGVCLDVLKKCTDLVSLDYKHIVVQNTNGELCGSYPLQLIIMEYELKPGSNRVTVEQGGSYLQQAPMTSNQSCLNSKSSVNNSLSHDALSSGTIYENEYNAEKLRELFCKARMARCRGRFPLPVILFRGKHICRSSTLSCGPEIYSRSGFEFFFSSEERPTTSSSFTSYSSFESGKEEDSSMPSTSTSSIDEDSKQKEKGLFDKVRTNDKNLLKELHVGTIIDFMVENKKVKCGVNVTSSEKVDKEQRYSEFKVISLPYPGCEFFREYRDNDYLAEGLVFDWNQSYADAALKVPDDHVKTQVKVDWKTYKSWDLVSMTQNYLQLILRYLVETNCGMLVHCISGWDRTPLFISLLRLSLWADGAIHQSLSAEQILYFTIAYDWMLFGHNLEDRLHKGEDIFFFCFYIIKHLVGDEFSVIRNRSSKHISSSGLTKTDSADSQLDSVLFDQDGQVSSQGSNVSLNSSWSSISSRTQDTPPTVLGLCGDDNGNSVPPSHFSIPPPRKSDKNESMTCQSMFFVNNDLTSKSNEFALTCVASSSSSLSSSSSSCTERSNATLPSVIGSQNSQVPANNLNCNINQCQFTSCGHDSDCDVQCTNDSYLFNNDNCNFYQQRSDSPLPSVSPSKMHTSPVAVPSRTTFRHRNESTSSSNVGSWQFISGTGSLRGSSSNSTCGSQGGSNNSQMSCDGPVGGGGPLITDSTNTLIEDDCFIYSNSCASTTGPSPANTLQDPNMLRKEKLRQVRELFYQCYCSTVGLKTKDGSEGGISNFLGNFFAEKVGIRTTQRTSV